MTTSNQISPGMTISITGKLYRVESSVKVTMTKGASFFKTKLKDLVTEKVLEKNFKLGQKVKIVTLKERKLEYLYLDGKDYLFLDVDNLDKVNVPVNIVGEKVDFLKEGVEVTSSFYGETVFSVELPLFLELMVVSSDDGEELEPSVSEATKKAVLETGAKVSVPLFIEVGDIIKVDTNTSEYIQRV